MYEEELLSNEVCNEIYNVFKSSETNNTRTDIHQRFGAPITSCMNKGMVEVEY